MPRDKRTGYMAGGVGPGFGDQFKIDFLLLKRYASPEEAAEAILMNEKEVIVATEKISKSFSGIQVLTDHPHDDRP